MTNEQQIIARCNAIGTMVREQAAHPTMWTSASTTKEAQLQHALASLHALIEGRMEDLAMHDEYATLGNTQETH